MKEPPINETHNRRVLIIEDSDDSAEMLKVLLEMSDYTVETASDGKSGIEKAAESEPHIIICDIGLPDGMSGYDVIAELKSDERHNSVYFVALSGYGRSEDKEKSATAGFHKHFVKPVDFDILLNLLGEISI